MVTLALRPETPADRDVVLAVLAGAYEAERAAAAWAPRQWSAFLELQHEARERAWQQAHPSADRVIVEHDGATAGRLCVDRGDDALRIIDIGLLPEARGRGIGTAVLGDLLDEAARRGMPVRLSVVQGNPARQLYERLGFHVTGTTGIHDHMEWRAAR